MTLHMIGVHCPHPEHKIQLFPAIASLFTLSPFADGKIVKKKLKRKWLHAREAERESRNSKYSRRRTERSKTHLPTVPRLPKHLSLSLSLSPPLVGTHNLYFHVFLNLVNQKQTTMKLLLVIALNLLLLLVHQNQPCPICVGATPDPLFSSILAPLSSPISPIASSMASFSPGT